MVIQIILIAAAIFGLIWSFRFGNTKTLIITIGIALSLILVLLRMDQLSTYGIYLYLLCLILALIHGWLKKGVSVFGKLIYTAAIAPVAIFWLFKINHWPGAHLLIIPAVIFVLAGTVFIIRKKSVFKEEYGFLAIIVVDVISILTYLLK